MFDRTMDFPGTDKTAARRMVKGGLVLWCAYLLLDGLLAVNVWRATGELGFSSWVAWGPVKGTLAAFYPEFHQGDDWAGGWFYLTWMTVVAAVLASCAWAGWRGRAGLAKAFLWGTLVSTGVAIIRMVLAFLLSGMK